MDKLSFTAEEYAAMERAVGRDDAPVHGYIRDLERLGSAYAALVAAGDATPEIPPPVRGDLEALVAAARAVAGPLYRLPDDLRALLTLRLVSESTSQRALTDLQQVLVPLEDLAAVAAAVLDGEDGNGKEDDREPHQVLIQAASQAYRNAFNIRVELGAVEPFKASLRVLLGVLAARGVAEAARLEAGLEAAMAQSIAPAVVPGWPAPALVGH